MPAQLINVLFVGLPLLVFAGMFVAMRFGHRMAARYLAQTHSEAIEGSSTIEAALFALFGLLIAFSFSGAETRLDIRRDLIVEEANAIERAYLRLDLLPEPDRTALQGNFRRYVDARIAFYRQLLDPRVAQAMHARASVLQHEIWQGAIAAAARTKDASATMMTVPALNEMIDVTNSRDAVLHRHIPLAIFVMLGILAVACAVLAGMSMGRARKASTFHILMFAGTVALTTYVILNLEFPRLGFVRLVDFDSMLVQVRADMR